MMKKLNFLCAALVFVFFSNAVICYSQEEEQGAVEESFDELDDLDSLFEDAQDVDGESVAKSQQESSVASSSPAPSMLTFYGSFTADLVYSEKVYDREGDVHYPGAGLTYTFGVSMRPSSDLSARCAATVSFPSYSLYISTLYFDYVLFGKAYLTVGKTTQTWGNSVIYDTNMLDDTGSPMTLCAVSLPLKHGTIDASANLYSFNASALADSLYYTASAEYVWNGFSYKIFGRTWANADSGRTASYAGNGAAGLEVTGDLWGFHTTLYGALHTSSTSWTDPVFAKVVVGTGRIWEIPQKIGFVTEYQMVYDSTATNILDHCVALTWSWSHVCGSRYSAAMSASYEIMNQKGSVVPAVAISGLPHATVNFALPVLFNGATYSRTSGNSTYSITGTGDVSVFLTAYINLSFSY